MGVAVLDESIDPLVSTSSSVRLCRNGMSTLRVYYMGEAIDNRQLSA